MNAVPSGSCFSLLRRRNTLDSNWQQCKRTALLGVAFLAFCLWSSPAFAQTGTIVGTVTEASSGSPLAGVRVTLVGTDRQEVTEAEGRYELDQLDSGTCRLRAALDGYETVTKTRIEVEEGETTRVAVTLGSSRSPSDQLPVGYGTQRSLSGAVSEVTSEDLTTVPGANNTDKLAGRVPGLVTKQRSGLPGGDRRVLSIRGFGRPLVLVDGMEMPMSRIDPHTIASISVLKDASAALYGARGGNGVILVETKRGTEGQAPRLNYNGSVTAQQPTRLPEPVDAGQYATMLSQAEDAYGIPRTFSVQEVECYKTRGRADGCEEPERWKSYDWYDAVFRDWAPQHQHNLNVRGGTEDVQYFVSGGYLSQGSAFSSGDFNFRRWGGRANLDVTPSSRVNASLDVAYRREFRERPGTELRRIWRSLQTAQPFFPPSLPDTSLAAWSGSSLGSPLGESKREISGFVDDGRDWVSGQLQLSYDVPLLEGLSAEGALSYLRFSRQRTRVRKPFEIWSYRAETNEYILRGSGGPVERTRDEETVRRQRFRPGASLRYTRQDGPHSIEGLIGAEWIQESMKRFGLDKEEADANSYLSRFRYVYGDRYVVEGMFRGRYGSSLGTFYPGVSTAWRMSEEAFLEDTALSEFKLRLSYSQMASPFSLTTASRMRVSSPEHTLYNAGLDGTLWNGLLGFQADVYYRFTEGRIGRRLKDVRGPVGGVYPKNINDTADRGVDLKLTHENTIGEVFYSVASNFGFTRRKLVNIAEEQFDTEWERRIFKHEGKWARRTVGYVAIGQFRSQGEIDSWPVEQDGQGNSSLKPGDIKYLDINGDGVIDLRDQRKIGDGGTPNINYGMNFDVQYQGFAFSGLLQGASMFDVMIAGHARGGFGNGATPYTYQYEHRWTEANKDARLPASVPLRNVDNNNVRFSSFWLKDGTYLRLKNLNVSYTLPDRWLSSLGVRTFRVYVAGSNLYTWDRLGIYSDAIDPESPATQELRQYPVHRTVSVGLNLSL